MKRLQGKGWDGPARCHDLVHAEQHSVVTGTRLVKTLMLSQNRKELTLETAEG